MTSILCTSKYKFIIEVKAGGLSPGGKLIAKSANFHIFVSSDCKHDYCHPPSSALPQKQIIQDMVKVIQLNKDDTP